MYKTLAFVFAVFIWAWVQTEQVVDKRARARVIYVWPDGLIRVQDVPKTLVVTLRGPQGLVRNLEAGHLRYQVDLTEAKQGQTSVDFNAKTVGGLPDGVSVVQVSPPAVDIELDRRLEREVRVKETVIGDVATGYKLGVIDVEPRTIQITGPQSLVRQISEVTTDLVDLNGLTQTTQFDVGLALKERMVTTVESTPISVTVNVSAIIVKKTFNDVPIMARGTGWRPTASTAVVTLEGNAADMLELSPEQVSVQVHLPEPVPPGNTLEVRFDKKAPRSGVEVVHQGPGSVRVVAIQPATVTLVRSE
jgi:hypothetical protein